MRYVTVLKVLPRKGYDKTLQGFLTRLGIQAHWRTVAGAPFVEIPLEKGDPRFESLQDELRRSDHYMPPFYEPRFELWEVDQAKLLRVFISGLCGPGTLEWQRELGLSSDARVIDRKALGRQAIALTYSFEIIVQERVRMILEKEHLTGWRADPVQHTDASGDPYPPSYLFTATNELPRLNSETELHQETHTKPLTWPPGHPLHGTPDLLFGTVGLFQRGPLIYRRDELARLEDFNRTLEVFGEATQAHPIQIISQRAWRVLRHHRIRKVEVEPVILK